MRRPSTAFLALAAGLAVASPLAAREGVIESWRKHDITISSQLVIAAFDARHPELAVRSLTTAPAQYNAASSAELDGGTTVDLVTCRPFDTPAFNELGLDWPNEEGRLASIAGEPKLTDGARVAPGRTLERWADDAPSGFEAQSYPASQNLFTPRRAGVFPTGCWEIRPLQRDSFFATGVFEPPVRNAGDPCVVSDHVDSSMRLDAASESKKDARTFIQWVGSAECAELSSDAPEMNVLEWPVAEAGPVGRTRDGALPVAALQRPVGGVVPGVVPGVRPESFASGSNETSAARGKLVSSAYLGRDPSLHLELDGGNRIVVEVPAEKVVMATVRQGFLADDQPIDVTRSIYRADRYDFVSETGLGQM